MRVVFMGTPDFAVPTLQMLIDEGHTLCAVVTQPDKPKGRGKKEAMPPIKELALRYNLPVLQPQRIRGDEAFFTHIQSLNPDIIVVVAFGQILPESILTIPKYGCINIHGSLLPKYRGAAPIQWSIINGEDLTGVTIMYMDKGMDTGDMLLKKEIPITKEDTYETLHGKMKEVGAKALLEAMPLIVAGGDSREKQEEAESTYAPMIQKSLGEMDWSKPATTLDCLIRGLNPWPVCYTTYKGEVMKVWKAKVLLDTSNEKPGTLLKVDKEGLQVQTGVGSLLIEELQMPNKKRMPVSEYIKGNTLLVGEVLGTYE
ncbi:methionyl-tRNA formyltransferase [Sporanaerobium hydrogeniformans]|uniref:Methionyl-tRNA formyltransferase n=1 Tax=Sporanaerobium hydrogeniformans TaxID=3072179 RepID=A0AC61DFC6_9FIRM|nr:methionyl-tRNA formyltransferase [Sporanaerobium hydrogeniformans]PHV71896.1 methionyl-tRNA formyltransferase [Sporanaerobium hydrogeniformans]